MSMKPIYWRFFTYMQQSDCGTACYWAWERLQNGKVHLKLTSHATLRDAVATARSAGFEGDVEPDNSGLILRIEGSRHAGRRTHMPVASEH